MGFIINAVKRLIITIIRVSFCLSMIVGTIVIMPYLPPYTKFTTIEVSPIQPRVGPLALNSALNNAGRAYSGKLLGPEAFQIFKGELYTSLATGEIVKLSPEGHVTYVTTVGQPCSGVIYEHICGRPLGIVIDEKDESLYVADAYHGIWKVNLKTNKKQLLVSPRVEIENRQPKLFNSIALAKNGDLYWTDSSSDFHLKDGALTFMSDPSGRLFHYVAAKNQSKVLLDKLWFPNGVALSPNNDFVVVLESSRARIMKYYISGPKKGQSEVFVDGLPGVPDNARALPDGSGVLVALYTVFEEGRPPITQLLAATPVVRKLVARLHRLVEIPFEYLNTIYPHVILEEIVYFIGHFKSISGLTPALSGLLQIDWDGNIVAGYYNTDKTLGHVSDAIVFNDKLYTGSPHLQDFVGTVSVPPLLKKAFESPKNSKAPKVEKKAQNDKPVQQAPIKKTEEKPKAKVEEKPKVETKPKFEEKPKTASKPVEEKAKVAKPVTAAPKPPQQDKPVEHQPAATKPSAEGKTPQEVPKAPAPQEVPKAPAPQEVPKAPAPQEVPKTSARQEVPKAPAPQQVPKSPSPQQARKATAPPKAAPAAAKPEPVKAPIKTVPKPAAPKPDSTSASPKVEKTTAPPSQKTPTEPPKKVENEAPKKVEPAVKKEVPKTAEIKPKPIREEIPSDTAKPTKETLKVIKRDGPAEINVPKQ